MVLHCYYQNIFGLIIIVSSISTDLVQSSSTRQICAERNDCVNGVCVDTNTAHVCLCSAGWTGELCDYPDGSCRSVPADFCKNGGVCYLNNTKFTCQCRYPYTGNNCEILSECFEYCLNNGACEIENDIPKCKCTSGWTGIRCQRLQTTTTTSTTSPGSITNIPCTFLGTRLCNTGGCVIVNNQIRCECPPTHSGNQCEIFIGTTTSQTLPTTIQSDITCAPNPCRNNRPCFNNGASYFCYCGSQYTGTNCENSV